MWFTLLMRDIGRSAVVFDEAEPQRILAFGISAALSRGRFEKILSDKAPFIGRTLLDEWLSEQKPFLNEREYAFENASDGLHVFVLQNGISESVGILDFPNMLSRLSENFVNQYAGCQLRAVAHEAFGVPREFSIDLGMQLIEHGPEHHQRVADCPVDRRPSIVMVTREQAQQHPGNITLNALFLRFSPPRFSLNAIERRLLRFALEGESDVRIADFLEIAPRTVKKRWAEIYLAMESVTGVQRGELSGHRGAEVRRHVLRYVRQHPEELHACAHSTVTGRRPKIINNSGGDRYWASK